MQPLRPDLVPLDEGNIDEGNSVRIYWNMASFAGRCGAEEFRLLQATVHLCLRCRVRLIPTRTA